MVIDNILLQETGKMKNKKIGKLGISEDWCFVCKDGGDLRVCDYRSCLKAYHPPCVKRDSSLLETKERWLCDRHFCFNCRKSPKFDCFCCPFAVCGRCLGIAEFAQARGKRGFCNTCLELILLIESNKDTTTSDGTKIDFDDTETFEFLFKGYWDIIKVKEDLTKEMILSAHKLLKSGNNYKLDTEPNEASEGKNCFTGSENEDSISGGDDLEDVEEEEQPYKRIRNKSENSAVKVEGSKGRPRKRKNPKPIKNEIIGWGSTRLFEFLSSIGRNITDKLSQYDVACIVTQYCKEKNLFDPVKKRKVNCDERLRPLIGRKSVSKYSIYDRLTFHFAENMEKSDDDAEYSSGDKDENVIKPRSKKHSILDAEFRSPKMEAVLNVQRSNFASIVGDNIKLLFLRRSLVEELLKEPETFDAKLMGSLVRIKSDSYDYLQKNAYQLLQVTGINKALGDGVANAGILLQVSIMPKDIPICKLSDDDFTEDECVELRQRVKDGLIKRPVAVELEKKARSLHEHITKHWIKRELIMLQRRIDRANEKGWRKELAECMDKLMLLKTPAEQSRLLNELPEIIADMEPVHDDSLR